VSYNKLVLPKGRRRGRALIRLGRAIWRDSSALYKEFRRPLLTFLIAVFGGGWLYGELMVLGGYERLPYIDLPYIMLALMIIEPPTDVPGEWYLIIFWYVMPVIAIYVIGRGAVDFFRLFFNRSERRDAWEEALASTYRNHIIVMGAGHVGLRVIRMLVQMGFDVVAVNEMLTDELDTELSQLGVPCVIADGRQVQTLEKASLREAHAFIACTSNDHVNLEAVMRVRDMNPDIRIVSRMWDNQFAQQLKRFMGVNAVISSSDLAAPAFAGLAVGIEITQTLLINGEEYSMIRLDVQPDSFLDNDFVDDLQNKYDMDIVLHGRGDDIQVHPDGHALVSAGDTLVIFAKHDKVIDIVSRNQQRSARSQSGTLL
jgi:Trk K+ transport system NAD-binding subunit